MFSFTIDTPFKPRPQNMIFVPLRGSFQLLPASSHDLVVGRLWNPSETSDGFFNI